MLRLHRSLSSSLCPAIHRRVFFVLFLFRMPRLCRGPFLSHCAPRFIAGSSLFSSCFVCCYSIAAFFFFNRMGPFFDPHPSPLRKEDFIHISPPKSGVWPIFIRQAFLSSPAMLSVRDLRPRLSSRPSSSTIHPRFPPTRKHGVFHPIPRVFIDGIDYLSTLRSQGGSR